MVTGASTLPALIRALRALIRALRAPRSRNPELCSDNSTKKKPNPGPDSVIVVVNYFFAAVIGHQDDRVPHGAVKSGQLN
jgi:hypothetical protein